MELVVGFGVGVLHGDSRTEVDVFFDGLAERLIVGEVRRVEGCHVEVDEPLSLSLGDVKAPVDVDQMCEAELACEAIGTTKRLSGEGGEVIDVFGLTGTEERVQKRILEDAAVERFLEAMQRLLATCEFV